MLCARISGRFAQPSSPLPQWFNIRETVALYAGNICGYDADAGLYLIHYCDGDKEELEESDVSDITVTPSFDRVPLVAAIPPWVFTHMDRHCLFAITGVNQDLVSSLEGFDHMDNVDCVRVAEFFLFVLERQYMYERRKRGDPAPWSMSTVLQRNHWCNNYRELDRGTAYFRSHVLTYRAGLTKPQLLRRVLFDSYLYRQINRVETFAVTGFPLENSIELFIQKLDEILKGGKPVFTAAHQTTHVKRLQQRLNDVTIRDPNSNNLLDNVFEDILKSVGKASIVNALKQLPGVSHFTAWQILCDLQECHCVAIDDSDNFCELGPGAQGGLKKIFGRVAIPTLKLAQLLVDKHQQVYDHLGVQFPFWRGRALTMKEIEHALCEFQKFPKGGRRYYSQQGFDKNETCFDCRCITIGAPGMKCCDTCRNFFCYACYTRAPKDVHDTELSWICHKCKSFESGFR